MKKCPYCAKEVQDEATKCEHCGGEIKTTAPAPSKTKSDNKKALKYLGYFLLAIIAIGIWYVSLPALAIWYVWKKMTMGKPAKIAITVVLVVLMFVGIAKNPSATKSIAQPQNNLVQSEKPKKIEEVVKKPVEPFNVVVESQIVKKTPDKYRYFFDVRNKDTKNFSGKFSISLYNDKQQSALGKDNFETSHPVEPGLGNFVYIDINTAPKAIHGEYGITTFKYEITVDGAVVKSGEGKITDKFEDLSI